MAQFGFNAQDVAADTETFTFTLFSGTTPLGVFTVGPLNSITDNGQLAFFGAKVDGGSITSILISNVSSTPVRSNGFAIGPVTFATALAAAPEPSQFATSAIGLLGLGTLALKAKKCQAA